MPQSEILIPAAGLGTRMKSRVPKSLIELPGGETVIGRQIRIVRTLYPEFKINVVVGFQSSRIKKHLDSDINIIENPDYHTTNVAKSIQIGLDRIRAESVLVIYGDLVFNAYSLYQLPLDRSGVLIAGGHRSGEIGVNVNNELASFFGYTLPDKWGHICVLHGLERELFKKIANEHSRHAHLSYEIFNEILDSGGVIHPIYSKYAKISELDSAKDINKAKGVCRDPY